MSIPIKVCDDELQEILDGMQQEAPSPLFGEFLGLTIESPEFDTSYMKFEMREAFLGNIAYVTLQGGIISTVLDIVGGMSFLSTYSNG